MTSTHSLFRSLVIAIGASAFAPFANAQIVPPPAVAQPAAVQPVVVQPAPAGMQPVAVVTSAAEPIVVDATNVIAQSMTMPGGGIPRTCSPTHRPSPLFRAWSAARS